jgi:MFS-type transporter involved in bile tolerance (Atg22 family)
MNIKTSPTNNFSTFTNFTCFSIIFAINLARHKKSNIISFLLYFSIKNLQSMFIKVNDNFFLKKFVNNANALWNSLNVFMAWKYLVKW